MFYKLEVILQLFLHVKSSTFQVTSTFIQVTSSYFNLQVFFISYKQFVQVSSSFF